MNSSPVIEHKRELSQRIFTSPEAIRKPLKTVYDQQIKKLESITQTSISTDKQEKIWNALLEILNKTYANECSEQILSRFKEEDILKMLEEHQTTGKIQKLSYVFSLLKASQETIKPIKEAVAQKTENILNEWVLKLPKLLKEEGIEFSI